MKRLFLLLCVVFQAFFMSADHTDDAQSLQTMETSVLKRQIRAVEAANLLLNDSLTRVVSRLKANTDSINSMKEQLTNLSAVMAKNNSRLNKEIGATNSNLVAAHESTRKGFLKYAFYAGGLLLVSLIGFLTLYLLMHSRLKRSHTTINELKDVQKRILEESLQLDNKLISIIEKEKIETTADTDHSLALKVADEVVRIEMNLSRMDKSIKGYKQLSKAVERIKNNFLSQGYEIVDMLGTPYNEGMRINADFMIDDNLPVGSRVITSITKPQINYRGQMIQKAIVTISQNI